MKGPTKQLTLSCRDCGATVPAGELYQCPSCGGSLEVCYDLSTTKIDWSNPASPPRTGAMWAFVELLPVIDAANIVTLGEGNTPLIGGHAIARALELDLDLSFKLETVSPSGSFKDRPISVAISKARELGMDTVVLASTGNAAASAAMYAARAGMRCVVCVPEATEPEKTVQCRLHGATLSLIRGTYSDSFRLAKRASELYRWSNVSTTYLNPYTIEGDKTVAFEVWMQLGGRVPDWILVPVGAGPLLAGIAKGFKELVALRVASRVPRMVGIQAESCSPIVEAFEKGSEHVRPWSRRIDTVAHAIADPLAGYERDGDVTLRAIRETDGRAISVSEAEIATGRAMLGTLEGISAEPASATVVAALAKLFCGGPARPGESAVCIVTGHGLKHPVQPTHGTHVIAGPEELYELVVEGC